MNLKVKDIHKHDGQIRRLVFSSHQHETGEKAADLSREPCGKWATTQRCLLALCEASILTASSWSHCSLEDGPDFVFIRPHCCCGKGQVCSGQINRYAGRPRARSQEGLLACKNRQWWIPNICLGWRWLLHSSRADRRVWKCRVNINTQRSLVGLGLQGALCVLSHNVGSADHWQSKQLQVSKSHKNKQVKFPF